MRRGLALRDDTFIMKNIVPFIIVMFLLSYQTLEDCVSFIGIKSTALAADQEAREIEIERDAEKWDLSQLDTARSVDYLTAGEKNIVLELNKVRTNPKKYANLYLVPSLKYYQGKKLTYPGRTTIITKEGRTAVEECIKVLSSVRPVKSLLPSKSLSLAAKDHVLDTAPKGIVGHTGSDGSSPGIESNGMTKHFDLWRKPSAMETVKHVESSNHSLSMMVYGTEDTEELSSQRNMISLDFRWAAMQATETYV